ncbi:DNA-binding MarR family transcriptional regulator [Krasilnikovia cinnamomea]|uniref:DNA-binding MarR family transcriptional regulator n=1 Tax=Krasilnikovia cinnamomea TaxID=349313 RepID=A0A4Q7ZKU5_9ACTN|nr:MarR family transcriptional regulator [Krasilnikovia cinnamomea]RZU51181.1 DNA-binding MarR family transcriptional regulator [Krasilnikovia cinnamomea]
MTMRRENEAMRVFAALVRAVHAISQDGARELRTHGFTPAQYQLLVLVGADPGCRQHQLGEALGVTKSNVSMLITKLEAAGLLARVPEGAAYALHLTPEGAATVARLRPEHSRFIARRFADLDDDELACLKRLVDKLSDD